MSSINLYNKEQLEKAKKELIELDKDITTLSLKYGTSAELDVAVKLSKEIVGINGDIELAIALDGIEYFQNLTRREASSEELWATLNIEYFSEYTKTRWLSGTPSRNQILQRVFKDGKNMYNRNSIARLWWVVNRAKDNTLNDPYEYVRILLSRTQFEQSILESALAKNDDLLKKIMSAIVCAEREYDIKINGDQIKEIVKRLNLLGGTYVLDIMDCGYFYHEILNILQLDKRPECNNIFTENVAHKNLFL